MIALAHEQVVAVLTVVHPDAGTTTRIFVEDDHESLDPIHQLQHRGHRRRGRHRPAARLPALRLPAPGDGGPMAIGGPADPGLGPWLRWRHG